MSGVIHPAVQYPAEELKTEISKTPIPVARSLAKELASGAGSFHVLTGADGGQLSTWALQRALRTARKKVDGLPAGFRYHDLRHYLASLLSPPAPTSRPSRPGCGTPRPRPRWTRTVTCGRTGTSRPGRPSGRFSPLVRTPCGLRLASDDKTAGQPRRDGQTS
jgi:hypothetical protein